MAAKVVLGLDIGSFSVKAVELAFQGGRYSITNYGCEPLEGAGEDAKLRAVRNLVSRYRFKAARIVTSVSGRSVIVRYVNVRKMSSEELRQSMQYEADKYIPFSTSEVVIDCQRIEGVEAPGGEMKVLLVAVKRNVIDERMALLRSANLVPSIIDVDSFALGNAFTVCFGRELERGEGKKVRALIDVGASKTDINIISGDLSEFTREVYIGGNDFTENISRKLTLDPIEVEKIKREPGDRIDEIKEAISPSLDDLQNEIQLSFDFYENEYDTEVNEIFLSGGGMMLPGVEESFTQAFSRPVTKWSAVDKLETRLASHRLDELKAAEHQIAIAVGLASRIGKI